MDKYDVFSWVLAVLLVGGLISAIVMFELFAMMFLILNFIAGSYILKLAIKEIITNKTLK